MKTSSEERWTKALQEIDRRDWESARHTLQSIVTTSGDTHAAEAESLLKELGEVHSHQAAVDFLNRISTDDLAQIENKTHPIPARFSRESLQLAWTEHLHSIAGRVLADRQRQQRDQAAAEERERTRESELARTQAREQFLQVILGPRQGGYAEHGFKGVELGTRFEELANRRSLKPFSPFETAKFQSSSAPGEYFYFDANDRLVAMSKTYEGSVDEYIPQLIEVFGRSKQDVDEVKSSNAFDMSTKATISYRFETTWVRIVASSMTSDRGGNRRLDRVFLIVVDEAWLAAHVLQSLEHRREQFLWAKDLLSAVEASWKPSTFPNDLALRIEPQASRPGAAVFHFFDERVPLDRRRKPSSMLDAAAGLRLNVESIDGTTVPPDQASIEVLLNLPLHPANTAVVLKGQQNIFRLPSNPPEARSKNYDPLAAMGLSDLLMQANLTLLLPAFRPADVESVTRSVDGGAFHYRWKSEEGWSLDCSGNDTVLISRPRRRRL